MNRLKVSQKDIKLLIILLAVLILAGVYQFVYVKNMDQLNVIKEENSQLEGKLMDLRNKESKRAEKEAENEKMNEDIKAKVDQYGVGASNEKSIMFIKNMEEEHDMTIGSASFMEATYFLSKMEDVLADDTGNYKINGMEGYQSTILMDFRVSYEGLKECIEYINQYPEKSNIDEITISYDTETGLLGGTLSVSTYHLIGGNRLYSEPVIGGVKIGRENIFGTIELPSTE